MFLNCYVIQELHEAQNIIDTLKNDLDEAGKCLEETRGNLFQQIADNTDLNQRNHNLEEQIQRMNEQISSLAGEEETSETQITSHREIRRVRTAKRKQVEVTNSNYGHIYTGIKNG